MPKSRRQGIPASEWAAAGVGAALVLASLAILIHGALTSGNGPPRLSLRAASVEKSGDRYLVMVEVMNGGHSTAADVRIEAELRDRDAVVERSEATIDFAPARSKRQAGVFFDRDPNAFELKLRASGYREP
jgi:uncharacterized protein (TIGR02588 family)